MSRPKKKGYTSKSKRTRRAPKGLRFDTKKRRWVKVKKARGKKARAKRTSRGVARIKRRTVRYTTVHVVAAHRRSSKHRCSKCERMADGYTGGDLMSSRPRTLLCSLHFPTNMIARHFDAKSQRWV